MQIAFPVGVMGGGGGGYKLAAGPSATVSSTQQYGNFPVKLTDTTGIVFYTNTSSLKAKFFTVGASSITFGTEISIASSQADVIGGCLLDTDKVLFIYSLGGSTIKAGIITNSSGTLTSTLPVTIKTISGAQPTQNGALGVFALSTNQAIAKYRGYVQILNISGTTITALSANAKSGTSPDVELFSTSSAINPYISSTNVVGSVLTIGVSSVSEGAAATLSTGTSPEAPVSAGLDSARAFIFWRDSNNKGCIATNSGGVLSSGSLTSSILPSASIFLNSAAINSARVLVIGNDNTTNSYAQVIGVSGTTVDKISGGVLTIATGTTGTGINMPLTIMSPSLAVFGYTNGSNVGKLQAIRIS